MHGTQHAVQWLEETAQEDFEVTLWMAGPPCAWVGGYLCHGASGPGLMQAPSSSTCGFQGGPASLSHPPADRNQTDGGFAGGRTAAGLAPRLCRSWLQGRLARPGNTRNEFRDQLASLCHNVGPSYSLLFDVCLFQLLSSLPLTNIFLQGAIITSLPSHGLTILW